MQGAVATNALLNMARVYFCLQDVLQWLRSRKEGRTRLLVGNDVTTGNVKFIIGVMICCSPSLLDALQKTLGMR